MRLALLRGWAVASVKAQGLAAHELLLLEDVPASHPTSDPAPA